MKVAMKNPKTGVVKPVKVGWSWTLFFFSNFFGIPLFMRGLRGFGILFAAVDILYVIVNHFSFALASFIGLIQVVLAIWIALTGNSLTGDRYLKTGWQFVDEDSESAQMARERWAKQIAKIASAAKNSDNVDFDTWND